jgi:hypothetical protein
MESDQSDEVEFLYHKHEVRKWQQEQHKNAPEVLAILRQRLPTEQLQEVEELLSTSYGCKCVCDILQREREMQSLREEMPAASSEEIEHFLETGIFESEEAIAKRRQVRAEVRQKMADGLDVNFRDLVDAGYRIVSIRSSRGQPVVQGARGRDWLF